MQVAQYVADHLTSGRTQAMSEAAAWLLASGKVRQTAYLTKDVARIIAESDYLYAVVTTARPLTALAKTDIEAYLKEVTGATTVELSEVVNSRIIGGVRIETPTAILDGTVHSKLVNLVEGMTR
jgi:F0F1-type ATP synthase delta subunit